MINTIVEVNSLEQTIPSKSYFETEKKRVVSGYLNLGQCPRSRGYFVEISDSNEFLNSRSIPWSKAERVPNVFSLNKPTQNTLFGSVQQMQQDVSAPFGLNFEIPRFPSNFDISQFLAPSTFRTEESQIQTQIKVIPEQVMDFVDLVQDSNISKAKYWEDLPQNTQKQKQLVEVTAIHISQKQNYKQSISQSYCVELIQQILLVIIYIFLSQGFQNQYFLFDTTKLTYQQIQVIYVEDFTSLKDIIQYFIQIATITQKLKFYLLKPSYSKIQVKIKNIIQSYLDEYQHSILQMQINNPDITIIEMYLYFKDISQQLTKIQAIFLTDDSNKVIESLYHYQQPYLRNAFTELINFQLIDFSKGINTQEFDQQIPLFYPQDFINTYTNTIQAMALITQLKQHKTQYIYDIIEICQIQDLSLQKSIQYKYQQIQSIYSQKNSLLESITTKFLNERQLNIQKQQQKRKQEYQRIQQNLFNQIQQQKHYNDEHKLTMLNQQQSLMMQIEINRINKKYQKLFQQQEERDLQLEQEIKEKQILQREKEKLLNQLSTMGVEMSQKNEKLQLEEEISIQQDQNIFIKSQSIQEEIQSPQIKKQIQNENLRQNNANNNNNYNNNNHQSDGIQVEQQILPEPTNIQEEKQIIYDDNPSLQVQLDICIGMHAKYHNKLVNKALHFILFEQLGFLNIWGNIRKIFFTQEGDYIDNKVFQQIDNSGWFVPIKLGGLDINPKFEAKNKLSLERQEFNQCNLAEQLQIRIDSQQQLLLSCFPSQILEGIMEIFSFVIKLRYCSYNLRLRWKMQTMNNKYCMLRYQMQQFVDLYLNYIFCHVIESTFTKFIRDLKESQSIDEMIERSRKYINYILDQSLIKSDKKSINDSYQQCLIMINQFIQIIDYKCNTDISQLTNSFRQKSEFFKMQIKMLKNDQFI